MNYLLDTNIISEVRKRERCDSHVATWYSALPDDSIYLSVLVLGEIRRGIERALSKDPARAAALDRWLTSVSTAFGERVLPIDRAVSAEWGRLSARRPAPVIDALLAATANVNGMVLVTRNVTDVADLATRYLNPFEPARQRR